LPVAAGLTVMRVNGFFLKRYQPLPSQLIDPTLQVAQHGSKKRILAGRPANFQLMDPIWLRYQDHIDTQPEQRPAEPAPDLRDISGN
jgi:hypothetical protein